MDFVKNSFRKSLNTYNEHAIAQRRICEQLVLLISKHKIQFHSVYEIGAGTGILTEKILQNFSVNRFFVNDKVPQAEQVLTDLFPNYKRTLFQFMAYDAETVFPDETFDLVVAASVIQWFTNPDKFFESVSNILNPQGLFVFNTFGALNLKECRTLTGKGLKSYGIEETKQMLSKDFHILVSFEEEIILNFPNPRHVLRHLQKTGVNGLKPEKWTKNHLKNFETLYSEKFSNSKEVQLTYHPQYFAAVKK